MSFMPSIQLHSDSKEVKEWMKELEGFYIPNIQPTKDSTCAGDPAAAANAAKNGWWTCGGYTRSTGPTSYLVDVFLGSSSLLF
jgi:hypothetical protein